MGISSGVCHVLLRIPVIACSAGKVAVVALAMMLRRRRSLDIVVVVVALVVAVVLALVLVRGHWRRLKLVVINLGRRVAAAVGGNSSMRLPVVAIERFSLGRVAVVTVTLHGGFDLRWRANADQWADGSMKTLNATTKSTGIRIRNEQQRKIKSACG